MCNTSINNPLANTRLKLKMDYEFKNLSFFLTKIRNYSTIQLF